jgi:glycosyltransferase involved in cell wall biosynthesis
MDKILTVVIPIYNMESWLPRCLDSILLDEILPEIEAIIVNDGSTDNSLSIAKSYREKYPEAVIIIDKPNGHYGSCVNAALKIASGNYFRILDADDCFDDNTFIKFIAFLQLSNADMVFTNYSRDYISGGRKIPIKHSSEEYIKRLLVMHAITYKTQILRDADYKQLEGICYTDAEYCFYPLVAVKSRAYFDKVLYRYTIGREGQSVTDAVFYKNRGHCYTVIKRMLTYLLNNKNIIPSNVCNLMYIKIIQVIYNYYMIILTHEKNDDDEEKMKEFDGMLENIDHRLYLDVGISKCYGILVPVKTWRKTAKYIGETKIFAVLKKFSSIKNRVLKRCV